MRPVRLPAVLCLLLLAGLLGVVSPAPAAAAVRDIRITQDGVTPERLQISPGDAVRFVNADTFVHRVEDDGGGWDFDTGTLLPGETFTVDPVLTRPGTYAYRGAGLDTFTGSVVVPGAGTAAGPSRAPRPAAAPAPVPVPAPASPAPGRTPDAEPTAGPAAAPAPARTGGSGRVQGPPPLAGGTFGGFDGLAPPASAGPGPLVAPDAPLGSEAVPPLITEAGPPPEQVLDGAGTTTAIGPLPALGTPVQARRLGLPLLLALVLAGGVVSLIVRLLLAEPLGRRDATA